MSNLWSENTPSNFWLLNPDPPDEAWLEAYKKAFPVLGISQDINDIETASFLSLGEGRYGKGHWNINGSKRLYYAVKPMMPTELRYGLRRQYTNFLQSIDRTCWPIEERFVRFQFEVVRELLEILGQDSISFKHFWPHGHRFAFVLTHDIETKEGQAFVREVADLEEELGFRSSFNFVPERYKLDIDLMQELRERGFEIGVHGLKHDGKLFNSKQQFMKRAESINRYLKEFEAVGFRAPLTIRNPYWMQSLDVEYDLSFFDTDPYEPIPGGCMSIWPFTLGRFIELPYTLAQDCTLTTVLGETTPRIWLQKFEYIKKNNGMALLNSHPDYLKNRNLFDMYVELLTTVREHNDYWHALPRDVSRWWLKRSGKQNDDGSLDITDGTILLENKQVIVK